MELLGAGTEEVYTLAAFNGVFIPLGLALVTYAIAGAFYAVLRPARGLQDCLAGAVLAPR
jgi:hypothetical protein